MDKKERFNTFLIIFVLTCFYVFIFSESGVLERRELSRKYNQLSAKIDYIKSGNLMLLKECENYRAGLFNDNDIIGSGFVYKTGKLMYISATGKETTGINNTGPDEPFISLDHLRIIWILISVMFLFYYFVKKNKSNNLADGPDVN